MSLRFGGTGDRPVYSFNDDMFHCYLSSHYPRRYSVQYGDDNHTQVVTFNCAYQHYQYEKARYFGDYKTAEMILKAENASLQKTLADNIKGYSDVDWWFAKTEIMHRVILAKFCSCPELQERLLAEMSPNITMAATGPNLDKYWGTGEKTPWEPYSMNPDVWTGKNTLGEILFLVYQHLAQNVKEEEEEDEKENEENDYY